MKEKKYKENPEEIRRKLQLLEAWMKTAEFTEALRAVEVKSAKQREWIRKQLIVPDSVLNQPFTI